MNKIDISIIIVNYKVENEIKKCIDSIFSSKPKVGFEIIVVDNDIESSLKKILNGKQKVKYIKSLKNIGFGAGNNIGAKNAFGKYLFFLNPDTIFKNNVLDVLFSFLENNPKAGMVAPLLLDPSGKIYPKQGSDRYTFKSAIIVNSFINKFFPNNLISKKFFHKNWNKKENEEFDVVPGTAFVIEKKLFKKVGEFDEKYFLYYEEYDLAERLLKLGYKNYILPGALVLHIWEASTKKSEKIKNIFSNSRNYFFNKNYGHFFAFMINLVSNFGKYEFGLLISVLICIFLGLFRINDLMFFIGDQGWYYLSAKNLIVDGQIPLVGIPSSHPWLHQGAFWTYLLALFLYIFNFNPVSGAYITLLFGVFSIIGIYIVGSKMFSKKVGLISAVLYATSPLVVYYTRFPYHTSLISFFVLPLIFFFYKLAKGDFNYLPMAILLLTILYNFEIATIVLSVSLFSILFYRILFCKDKIRQIFKKKIILYSIASLLIPLFPMILYDFNNGFPQTLRFIIWIFYKLFSFLSFSHEFSINKLIEMLTFLFKNFEKLIFVQNSIFAGLILICLIVWVCYLIFSKKIKDSLILIIWIFISSLIFVILNQVLSDAYLPMLFPICILLISCLLENLIKFKKIAIIVYFFIIFIVLNNICYMFLNNFYFDKNSSKFNLSQKILISKQILGMVNKKEYNLTGLGPGSQFESFTMPYAYLTWWLGQEQSKNNTKLKIIISEFSEGIKITK